MAISCFIQPISALAAYYPQRRTTASIYETVIVGYNAVIMETRGDQEPPSYQVKECRSITEAKKHLSGITVKI